MYAGAEKGSLVVSLFRDRAIVCTTEFLPSWDQWRATIVKSNKRFYLLSVMLIRSSLIIWNFWLVKVMIRYRLTTIHADNALQ